MKKKTGRSIYAPDDGHEWKAVGPAISKRWPRGVPDRLVCSEGTFVLKSYGGYVWKRELTEEERAKEDG